MDNEDENDELIDEYCSEVFNQRIIELNYDYYLNQYEGLFIKSFFILIYNYSLLLFILIIPLIIYFYINQNSSNEIIKYSFNQFNHLKDNYIYIGSSSPIYDQLTIKQIKYSIQKSSPLTHLIFLSNFTNSEQLNHFLWSMFTLSAIQK